MKVISFWHKDEELFRDDTSELDGKLIGERTYDLIKLKNKTGKWATKITIEEVHE